MIIWNFLERRKLVHLEQAVSSDTYSEDTIWIMFRFYSSVIIGIGFCLITINWALNIPTQVRDYFGIAFGVLICVQFFMELMFVNRVQRLNHREILTEMKRVKSKLGIQHD